jgi:CDP-diacylglycerol--serine O-phosphatidyltransferase
MLSVSIYCLGDGRIFLACFQPNMGLFSPWQFRWHSSITQREIESRLNGPRMAGEAELRGNWRFLIPNFFTACSAMLGLAALLLASSGEVYWSAWCILWSVLLDKVDGTAARILNASSDFGAQFDSMADLICFGLAPTLLMYTAATGVWEIRSDQGYWWVLLTSCGLYTFAAAFRLARFNTSQASSAQRYYDGMPTTLCAAVVALTFLVGLNHEVPPGSMKFMVILLGLLGIGMVSRLPVPKLLPRRNRFLNYFQIANVVAVYICGVVMKFPEYVLVLAALYLTIGIGHGILTKQGRV